jgi:gas vesicle protein
MLIFSIDSHAAATSRIADTLIGAAAGLAAGLLFAPLRVQPAKEAVGDLTRQMSDLLGEMSAGLAEVPEPRRAAELLESTRALRGEIERLDEALAQAEDSIRLNPRRVLPNPRREYQAAAGLREGVDTLERAATDMRVLARSVADSARIDSADSPVRDDETRAQLAAVLRELSAAIRAYGQLVETGTPAEVTAQPAEMPAAADAAPALPGDVAPGRHGTARAKAVAAAVSNLPGPSAAARLRQHLAEAHRRQDELADLLRTDPDQRPDGWPLRGEILNHVDRLRNELEPGRLGAKPGRPPYRGDTTGPMRALGRRVRVRRRTSAQRSEEGSQVRR